VNHDRPRRQTPLRKLLPWALLGVPLVFAARAATDYHAVPSATQRQPAAQTADFQDAPRAPAKVTAHTLLKLTTRLSIPTGEDATERRLLHVYAEVAAGNLDAAREQATQLVREHPHFALAQLALADVLQASSGRGGGFAALPPDLAATLPPAARSRLDELRAEALVRLSAYTNPPPAGAIAANLVALGADVKRALVIDTSRSRVYVFDQRDGQPVLRASYYFSQGRQGDGKTRAGDLKTPLGIYFITRKIDPANLKPLYGAGALTLNYPNEWDKLQGYTGFGVWLHGTPPGSYARVPRASDGCVVLSNPDVRSLMAQTPAGATPVVITRQVRWLSPAQWTAQRQRLIAQLQPEIVRAASLGLRPQDPPAAASAAAPAAAPSPASPIPASLSILQYPGQIVVQYSAANATGHAALYRQYWAQRSQQWQLIFQGSVS